MKVILIRHTSVDVPKGVCYGQTDVPVAATFPEEAELTKKALGDRTFDAVFSSPLTRARLLADYCGYPTPVTDNRLMEMNMGDWEMKRYDDIKDDNLQKWYDDYMHVATTNGESFPMVYERVAGFLDELKQKPYRQVAIFAHCGVLLCAGIYGGLFKEEGCFEHTVEYGGIEEIEI